MPSAEIADLAARISADRVVRKPAETIAAVLAADAEGWSASRIERVVGVHRDVVKKILAAAANEACLATRLAAVQ